MQAEEYRTCNKKVVDFYNKNPNYDFDMMSELFVDFLEELTKNLLGNITNSMTQKLNKKLSEQSQELSVIKEQLKTIIIDNSTKTLTIKEMNTNMVEHIINKLYEVKKDYLSDLKQLIDKHESDNMYNVIDKFDKEMQKIIKEIIPTNNNLYYTQYETLIKSFYNDIRQSNQTTHIEDKYNSLFSNIEKNIITYITCTESILNDNINDIKTIANKNYITQDKLTTELSVFLDKYKNSSFKGALAENRIESILNTIYPRAEINRTAQENKSGDFIMSRTDKTPILFEIKDYNRNIPTEEINKFIRDINEHKISGIFLSISTGISKKHNFQIDINENNNIMVYIHNMNYDEDKIKSAVDIIDALHARLNTFNKNEITISPKTIQQLNTDYLAFINKRTLAITHIKESHKKTLQFVEEMELRSLNEFLSTKFTFDQTKSLKCSHCNNFIGTNKKSLTVHIRRCIKKTTKINNTSPLNNTTSPNNTTPTNNSSDIDSDSS